MRAAYEAACVAYVEAKKRLASVRGTAAEEVAQKELESAERECERLLEEDVTARAPALAPVELSPDELSLEAHEDPEVSKERARIKPLDDTLAIICGRPEALSYEKILPALPPAPTHDPDLRVPDEISDLEDQIQWTQRVIHRMKHVVLPRCQVRVEQLQTGIAKVANLSDPHLQVRIEYLLGKARRILDLRHENLFGMEDQEAQMQVALAQAWARFTDVNLPSEVTTVDVAEWLCKFPTLSPGAKLRDAYEAEQISVTTFLAAMNYVVAGCRDPRSREYAVSRKWDGDTITLQRLLQEVEKRFRVTEEGGRYVVHDARRLPVRSRLRALLRFGATAAGGLFLPFMLKR